MGKVLADNDILLFKSTYRWEYRQRILTALSLPDGVVWRTHYRSQYCSNDIKTYVFGDDRKKARELVGKKGTLIFADINSDPPRFFPLREFEIASSEVDGENWVVGLKFGRYLAYSNDDINNFQEFLRDSGITLPPEDQSYAQLFPNIETNFKKCPNTDPAADFQSLVTQIVDYSDSHCFRFCDSKETSINLPYLNNPAVFFRLELDRVCDAGNITRIEINPEGEIVLKRSKFKLRFSYYSPHPENMNIEDHFYVEFGSSASLERREIIVYPNTPYKTEEFSFEVQTKPSTVTSEIQLKRYLILSSLAGCVGKDGYFDL